MALFEPSCGEAYADVFSDATDTDFCVLGYEGRKLKCDAKGVGALERLERVLWKARAGPSPMRADPRSPPMAKTRHEAVCSRGRSMRRRDRLCGSSAAASRQGEAEENTRAKQACVHASS